MTDFGQCPKCGSISIDYTYRPNKLTKCRCRDRDCGHKWTPVMGGEKPVELHANESPHETFEKLRQLVIDLQADRDRMNERMERVERYVLFLASKVSHLLPQFNQDSLKHYGDPIRRDLAELDRQRTPPTKE